MNKCAKLFSAKWTQCWISWRFLNVFIAALNYQNDLGELVSWARRKRLIGVRRHYQQLLNEVEAKLLFYQIRSRRIFELAQWVYTLKRQLQPSPVYYRGYASKYRKNKTR